MSGARVWVTMQVGIGAVALLVGCASPFPAVLTSTGENVAIEFETEGSLAEATKLAEAECAKTGKMADFDEVDQTATPSTRVARFKCVSSEPAASAAPATSEAAAPAPDAAASEPSDAGDSSAAMEPSDPVESPATE